MNARAFAKILLLGALWGAAFMFMRVSVPEFGAFAMAAARVGLACLIMLVIIAALRQSLDLTRRWKTYLGVGAVNTAIPFIAYSFAAQHIPAGYSAIANSTTPVWSALIMWLWFKQPLGALKWLGIVFAFSGVLVLVGLQPVALTPMVIAGIVTAVLAASMYATASFLIKRYLTGDADATDDHSQVAGATGMILGALVWLALPGLWFAPAVMPSLTAWAAILALSLFCTALGYLLFFNLIKTIGPQRASSVAFLFPAFAAFWGWLVLSEPITANMIAGMVLVLAGTALVSMGGAPTGATTTWERLRDSQALPFVFAILPASLRRRFAYWVSHNARFYRNEAGAVEHNLAHLLPELDAAQVADAVADHRFTRLVDHADMWIYMLRGSRWYTRNMHVEVPPDVVFGPGFYLGYHFGGGWWIASFLRDHQQTASMLFWDSERPQAPVARALRWIAHRRVAVISTLSGAPALYTNHPGVARRVISRWRSGVSLVALADVPPPLVDRVAEVQFFGRRAAFPPSLIELALRQAQPIYRFSGEWDRESMRPVLRVEPVTVAAAPATTDATLQSFVSALEVLIRRRPGAWHLWGDAPLFFSGDAPLEAGASSTEP